MKTWDDVRANWVNGNLQDAKRQLYQQSKVGMLGTISQALHRHLELLQPGTTRSGDAKDLLEIIDSIRCGKPVKSKGKVRFIYK